MLVACALTGCAAAQSPQAIAYSDVGSSRAMPAAAKAEKIAFGQSAGVPLGYYQMCVGRPELCQARSGRLPVTRDGSVLASSAAMTQLAAVNDDVNASIRANYSEDWTPGRPVGDCKDFAMTKRQRLIQAGWPSSAVPVAIVRTQAGEKHLILVARTSAGDYVLDNLDPRVAPWTNASYAWEKIQSPSGGLDWRSF
jgi:predicted transglutaminase-like cysteine proteinase